MDKSRPQILETGRAAIGDVDLSDGAREGLRRFGVIVVVLVIGRGNFG